LRKVESSDHQGGNKWTCHKKMSPKVVKTISGVRQMYRQALKDEWYYRHYSLPRLRFEFSSWHVSDVVDRYKVYSVLRVDFILRLN